MTLKLRLLLTVITLVFTSILVTAAFSLYLAVSQSTDALQQAARDKLTVQNEQTSDAVQRYLGFIESQIRAKSLDETIVNAAAEFIPAYNQYTQQRQTLTAGQESRLRNYYSNDFASLYRDRNNKTLENPVRLLSGLSENALALQYDFIAGSDYAIGEKDGLTELNNGSSYSQLHARYHSNIRRFLQEFGYYDIFIADINSGDIVYSVFKELDFATSIKTGPYASTGIGEAFRLASNATGEGQVFFSELTTYLPSYDAMAGFISTPIYKDGRAIAILIFQMPFDVISTILTHQQKWFEKGFGESGETYLVSPSGKLLTESRFFLETQNQYLNVIATKHPQVAQNIRSSGTSVGLQPVDSPSSKAALRGLAGFQTVLDYRDVEVYSVYSSLSIGDYNYALLAEIDVEEALRPANMLQNSLLSSAVIQSIILIAIAAAIAVVTAAKLVKPIINLGDTFGRLSKGEGDLTVQLEESQIPEIDTVVNSFNAFLSQIRDIISTVKVDADGIASASQQLSAVTRQNENTSKQQLTQAHHVSSAMQHLSESIAQVSESTVQTRDISVIAKDELTENVKRTDMAADNIKQLVSLIEDSSNVISSLQSEVDQITDVLTVITSIADQTNLLALNAAIEAARAGEAGRGFSVVADEVRALANRSQESTVEIANLVETMNLSSAKSVTAMEKAAATANDGIQLVDIVTSSMNQLAQTFEKVQTMTDTVANATTEQDVTADTVTQSVEQISQLANQVEQGATQTSESVAELAEIAQQANNMVGRFKV